MSKQTTHKFETEITQLLDLMIHSLYSKKEIFLRELISNASDAIDKRRFEALTDASLLPDESEMRVRISPDKENNSITISDTGLGMSQEEVIDNIGTIARSGTKKFMQALESAKEQENDVNLIGQFGVGFYSVFMVADEVTLTTRRAGEEKATRWISTGKGEYTLEETSQDEVGTSITLKLKEGESEYADEFRIENIIKKYSDHVSLPIELAKTVTVESSEEGDDENKQEETTVEWTAINTGVAIWARNKSEIEQEDYNNFYQSMTYDMEAPISTLHHKVEGNLEYTSLLFIPKKAPFDLYQQNGKRGLQLYVKRVFIMDDAENLLPNYLRFVKGVIDAQDLPLNVSREILQTNKDIEKIKGRIVKRVIDELARLGKDDAEQYQQFWNEFGQVIKEGVVEDFANKDKLLPILRFASTSNDNDEQNVALKDYVERMNDDQDTIYYITAQSYAAAQGSPHLEVFKKKGIEVLLLSDPVDEWLANSVNEFEGKTMKSVTKGDISLDEEEKKEQEKQEKEFSDILTAVKDALNDNVKEVRLTNRLTDSPACLVADENDAGANLERIMAAMGQDVPTSKPILELNPEHAIVKKLDNSTPDFNDWAHVLFDQAALAEGADLKNPAEYVKRINKLLAA
ncbi:MAG: molecular chaperone HtpG [Arenicella sp.]